MADDPPTAEWDDALLRDPHAVADKRTRVREMFAAIAPSYDLNNRLHSLWQDQRWRRKAVKLAAVKAGDVVVDVACGTGDLTIAFADGLGRLAFEQRRDTGRDSIKDPLPRRPLGIDFTFDMLPIAKAKTPDWWFPFYRDEQNEPILGDIW